MVNVILILILTFLVSLAISSCFKHFKKRNGCSGGCPQCAASKCKNNKKSA